MKRWFTKVGLAFIVLLVFAAGTVNASGATPKNLPAGGGYSWASCLYDNPRPPANTTIATFKYNIKLTCSGVQHIYAGHGFDSYTEPCISNTLNHLYFKAAESKSNSNNWLYSALWSAGGGEYTQVYQSFVVANRVSAQIVTAYTKTNSYAGDDSWYTCSKMHF
jgi:hypothetical protein